MPVTTEKGIVLGTYFRGLEQTPLHEGDKAFVSIHKIYGFDGDKTRVIENAAKRRESVII